MRKFVVATKERDGIKKSFLAGTFDSMWAASIFWSAYQEAHPDYEVHIHTGTEEDLAVDDVDREEYPIRGAY